MDQDNSELISNNGSFSKELSTHDSTCLDINENDEKFHLLSNSNIKQPSFKNRLIRAYKKLIIISSELTFFLFKVASSMYDPTVRLSAYDKVCVYDFNIDRDICNSHVTNHFSNFFKKVLNRDVQKLAAWHNFIYRMLVNLPAIVISLFTGPWSDKIGRQIPLMGSITGHILAMLVFIISLFAKSYYMVFFSLASFIIGISGRSSITTFSVYSHVSDNTSVNTRTFRIGMLSGCGYMGLCIGSLLVALLSPYIAVYYILAIVIFFLILCLLTVSFFLVPYVGENDTRIEMKQYDALNENKDDFKKKLNVLTKGESSNEQFYYAWWNFKKIVKEKPDQDTKISENCKRTATSVMTLFKKRENYQRLYLNFLIIFVFLHQASKAYHIDALLMITKSEPFFFTTAQFGYLLCITYIIFGLGALVLTPLFTKVLMLNDVVLLSFGCMANFVRFLCLTLSKEVWMIYASECIIGGSLVIAALKSILSKQISASEYGSIFSIVSAMETVGNLMGSVIFATIYTLMLKNDILITLCFTFEICSYFFILTTSLTLHFLIKYKTKINKQCNI